MFGACIANAGEAGGLGHAAGSPALLPTLPMRSAAQGRSSVSSSVSAAFPCHPGSSGAAPAAGAPHAPMGAADGTCSGRGPRAVAWTEDAPERCGAVAAAGAAAQAGVRYAVPVLRRSRAERWMAQARRPRDEPTAAAQQVDDNCAAAVPRSKRCPLPTGWCELQPDGCSCATYSPQSSEPQRAVGRPPVCSSRFAPGWQG